MAARLMRYRTDEGSRVALVREGRKYLHVLVMDSPLRVTKADPREARYMTTLKDVAQPKDLKMFRRFGRIHGMTEAAKSFIKDAALTETETTE